jgi:Ribbon-helix-helix protein, copG family
MVDTLTIYNRAAIVDCQGMGAGGIRYTHGVNAAVSLPDPLFEAADELARRLGLTRSELFAAALEAYLNGHRQADVTETLNEIYRDEDSSLDSVVAALRSARRGLWLSLARLYGPVCRDWAIPPARG